MPLHEISPCFVLIFFSINFANGTLDGFTLSFDVHCGQPSRFYRQRNGISVDSNFSIVAKEVMYVFSYVLDARRQILLSMIWFIVIFFPMSDNCIIVNVPTVIYPLGFFFLPFPSFVPLFGMYCVRRYNVRFLLYLGSI